MYLPYVKCAIAIFERALVKQKKCRGAYYAISLDHQGKYAEAEAMHRQVLQLSETVLGKEHPDMLDSMINLATSLRQQGKYAEAEAIERQTLQLKEMVLGKEHPDTLASMNNLAISLHQQGKHAEAEAMHRRDSL
jgi:tetratricopeptide (TPR) repeat protein